MHLYLKTKLSLLFIWIINLTIHLQSKNIICSFFLLVMVIELIFINNLKIHIILHLDQNLNPSQHLHSPCVVLINILIFPDYFFKLCEYVCMGVCVCVCKFVCANVNQRKRNRCKINNFANLKNITSSFFRILLHFLHFFVRLEYIRQMWNSLKYQLSILF